MENNQKTKNNRRMIYLFLRKKLMIENKKQSGVL
jgi:hypothetical protein